MQIFEPIKNFKSRLTSIGKKEPLHFFSLAIILALDIFVLINIFQGLYLQKEQLDKPREVVPYACQNLLLDTEETDEEEIRAEKISVLSAAIEKDQYFYEVNNKYASAAQIIENEKKEKVDSRCRELYTQALVLNNDAHLTSLLLEIEGYEKKIRSWENENTRYRNEYDTMLFEKIAEQNNDDSLTEGSAITVKRRIEENKTLISDLEKKIKSTENSILFDSHSQKFLQMIAEKQEGIEKTKSRLEFWYPLKKILVEMVFLAPLFLFFLWLYRKMLRKENSLFSLISSHLLLVTLIPIIIKIFELLLDILPFHFLSDLLDLLEALNIVALFNYILIIVGIGLVLGVIYFLQKKVFSAQKIWEKRIQKKECWSCGSKKSSSSEKFCSFCGEEQYEDCSSCGSKKLCKTEFCQECGEKTGGQQ